MVNRLFIVEIFVLLVISVNSLKEPDSITITTTPKPVNSPDIVPQNEIENLDKHKSKNSSVATWTYEDPTTKIKCVKLSMHLTIEFEYTVNSGTKKSGTYDIMEHHTVKATHGECGSNKQSITLEWHHKNRNSSNKLKFNFEKISVQTYSLSALELYFDVKNMFPSADPQIIKANLTKPTYDTKMNDSYLCASKEKLQLTTGKGQNAVNLIISSIQFEAFSKTTESVFSKTTTLCAATKKTIEELVVIVIISVLILLSIGIGVAVWCICCLGRCVCGSRRQYYSYMA